MYLRFTAAFVSMKKERKKKNEEIKLIHFEILGMPVVIMFKFSMWSTEGGWRVQ